MVSTTQKLIVDGQTITVSNLDKVLYPGGRFTKAQVIDYYIRIAKYLLPHLKDRPVTLKRFPNGVFGEFFYEKDAPAFTPDWIKTFPVPRRERNGEDIRYILVNNLPTLVWLANLANLEIHPFLHKVPRIDQPTSMVFDCDPGEGTDILACARVAFLLRDLLEDLGLECWAKMSGSKGLQVYVPFNTAASYEVTQALARGIAEMLAQREPKLIVAEMSKALRRGRVFIDWSQNSDFKTTVGVYSLRAKIHKPLVSMPVYWDELEQALKANDPSSLYFNPEAAITRADKLGDLFRPLLSKKQSLPKAADITVRTTKRSRPIAAQSESHGPRRSAQGSRRRFFLSRRGPSSFEIALEVGGVLKRWLVRTALPVRKGDYAAKFLGDRPLVEADFDKPRQRNAAWDLGTYEVVEGDLRSGELRIYLQGTRTNGEWTLAAIGDRRQWRLKKNGNGMANSKRFRRVVKTDA